MSIDGQIAATGTASTAHPVVAGTSRSNIGYKLTAVAAPGDHTVCVHATDPTNNARVDLGCTVTTVRDTVAFGAVDSLGAVTGGIGMAGWAQDLDTANPISVHVYVDGALTAVTANQSRPDVQTVYGNGDLHGFGVTIPAAPGNRMVCIYAIGEPSGTANPPLRCESVTVG